jgi:hypothetical protein
MEELKRLQLSQEDMFQNGRVPALDEIATHNPTTPESANR